MSATIKTVLRTYYFDASNPADRLEYDALCQRLKACGCRKFCTHGGKGHYFFAKPLDGLEIELETDHLFDNQWNTKPVPDVSKNGFRVFDWAEDYPIDFSSRIKRGHYLEHVPEMDAVRRDNVACGYCGHMEPASNGNRFCPACLGSEYLQPSDLRLTRLRAISDTADRAELTPEERAELMPKYREAQRVALAKRLARVRADIIADHVKATRKAETELNGKLWLIDHGLKIDNVIYYDHKNVWSFGWRKPVTADELSAILDVISEFPGRYEIKTDDGRTLNGD